MKLKPAILFALLCFNVVVAAACAENDFVFILRAKGNPYWNTLALGIEETARAKKISSTVYMLQSETAAEEQLNTCLAAIARKPKFLGVSAANVAVGIECLKKASSAGIIIADVDCSIPLEEAAKHNLPLTFSVGSDNFAVGKRAGEYVHTLFDDAAIEVFILEGAVGSPAGVLRVDGFKKALVESAPNAKIVGSLSGEWDRLKAMNVTADFVQRFPAIKLVYAANDMMALGAIEALKSRGMLSNIKVIGVDGTQDAQRAVRAGEMSATVAQLPYLIGKRAVELGEEVVSGKHVNIREVTDTPVITKAVLQKKDSAELQYVR